MEVRRDSGSHLSDRLSDDAHLLRRSRTPNRRQSHPFFMSCNPSESESREHGSEPSAYECAYLFDGFVHMRK